MCAGQTLDVRTAGRSRSRREGGCKIFAPGVSARNLIIFSAAALFAEIALAQSYPSGPIRIVVPLSPGGNVDLVTRSLAPKLAEQLGQQVLVDNRPGGNTVIGTETVARSAPD